MKYYTDLTRRINMIRRVHAERYMLLALISFSASVSFTRLFLSATGYPKIGGGNLHIAHVLWGGLLLFIAVLMVIILANRRIYTLSAIIGGAGMGLFIDEVGKFITQDNDYFFPAAAPIIYLFFLLIVFVFIQLRRPPRLNPNANLVRALELMQDMVQRPLTSREQKTLQNQLANVMDAAQSSMQTDLARTILDMVDEDDRPAPNTLHARWHALLDRLEDWYTPRRQMPLLVIGLLFLGLLAFKNPLNVMLQGHAPPPLQQILDAHMGNEVPRAAAQWFFQARIFFEVVEGTLLVGAAVLLAFGRRRWAGTLGFSGLLLGLVVVNIFLYYFEQFSTTQVVVMELLMLLGLAYFRESGG